MSAPAYTRARMWQHEVDQMLSALLVRSRSESECRTDADFASLLMMNPSTYSKLAAGALGWGLADMSRLAVGLGLSLIQLAEEATAAQP